MKHFICYVVTFCVIFFGGIALVNYTLDPGHVYHAQEYVDDIIEGVRKGYNVEGVTDIDERRYKLKFAELHQGKSFDYLALGSSRIMTVSEDIFHGASFLNLSISSCQIEELIAYYQICKDFNIHFSNLLITADPSLFNGDYIDDRWKFLSRYVNEYMGYQVADQEMDWDLVRNLFSISYFKMALKSAQAGKNPLKYVKTVYNEGETFCTDGSFLWSKAVREAPKSVIDEKVQTWHFHFYENFDVISNERIALFSKLLEDIKAEGVNIYILRSPYHPVFYKKMLKKKGVEAAFAFIDNYAKRNHIPLISSFDPADEGLNESDFYDGPHVRKEVLDKMIERDLFN